MDNIAQTDALLLCISRSMNRTHHVELRQLFGHAMVSHFQSASLESHPCLFYIVLIFKTKLPLFSEGILVPGRATSPGYSMNPIEEHLFVHTVCFNMALSYSQRGLNSYREEDVARSLPKEICVVLAKPLLIANANQNLYGLGW
ncbi:hypothetical protein VNO77_15080 [Canavalia gladiata]|uniref:Uncharacterized protein n=1 Tax=Canavalia gladiata TaxID=3824 RepID=A0AAN9LZB6_CANGL